MKRHITILTFISILFVSYNTKGQSYNLEFLYNKWQQSNPTEIEGFYKIDTSGRNYLVGVIKVSNEYQVIYLEGNSENWSDGDLKAIIRKAGDKYIASWNPTNPQTPALTELEVDFNPSGFTLIWPGDDDDHFKKIPIYANELIKRRFSKDHTVKMIKTLSGIYEVPANLNGVLKIYLVIDSGASEVSISPDVALTLMRTKTITESDWLEGKIYTFADGSTAKSERFRLKSLEIGGYKLENIEVSISNSINAPLLLGQNVLQRFSSVTFDFINDEFIIKEK